MVTAAPGPLRDSRADRDHFDRVIGRAAGDIERYRAQLALPADHRRRQGNPGLDTAAWVQIHLAHGRLFSASYSRGEDRAGLRARWESWLDASVTAAALKRSPAGAAQRAAQDTPLVTTDLYISRLWLVSAALALDVDDESFARVGEAVEPLLADRLISLLVASRRPEVPVADEMWFGRKFGPLAEVFAAAPGDRMDRLTRHLDSWYPRMRGASWWDGHRYGAIGHYIGYWSFESAGAVAALGIDDGPVRDHEHYPADLSGRGC